MDNLVNNDAIMTFIHLFVRVNNDALMELPLTDFETCQQDFSSPFDRDQI